MIRNTANKMIARFRKALKTNYWTSEFLNEIRVLKVGSYKPRPRLQPKYMQQVIQSQADLQRAYESGAITQDEYNKLSRK